MEAKDYETPHKCPVCGKYDFRGYDCYDICPICGWEDDAYQIVFPNEGHCANAMSLNEARKAYKEGKKVI